MPIGTSFIVRYFVCLALIWMVVFPAAASLEKKADPYMQLVGDALGYVQFSDWEAMLKASDEAIAMAPDRTHAWETRAKALLELGQWQEARSAYDRLATLMPSKKNTITYNKGEVYFREGEFAQAKPLFQKYVVLEEKENLITLAKWKILLCDLKLGNTSSADKFISTLSPEPFSPIYYYAQAARDFSKGARDEALETLITANRIYSEGLNNSYGEGLTHLGWLDGDELKAAFLAGSKDEYKFEEMQAQVLRAGIYYADPEKDTSLNKKKSKLPELPELKQ